MSTTENQDVLTLERRGHVVLMGLNRPHKRNAFNIELLMELGRAYELLERDEALRCGVLLAHGDQLTQPSGVGAEPWPLAGRVSEAEGQILIRHPNACAPDTEIASASRRVASPDPLSRHDGCPDDARAGRA